MLGPQISFAARDEISDSEPKLLPAQSRTLSGSEADVDQDKQFSSYTELLDIKILKEVRAKFLEYGVGESGDALKVEDFIEILSVYMPRQDVENVYKKIDVNDDGFVDWHEFTGFLINADAMKGSSAYGPAYRPAERAVQPVDRHMHRDMVEHLAFAMKPVPLIVTGCRDGSISLWNYNDLTFVGAVAHHDKNSIMVSSMFRSIGTTQKAAMKVAVGHLGSAAPSDGVCLTALSALSQTGHLCVASADCSLAVYDLATQEACGRLNNTGEMLTALAAFQSIDKRLEVPVPYIFVGDCTGYLSVIKIDHEFRLSADGGQKKKNQQIMEKALSANLNRVRLHGDWVTQLLFLPEMEQVISASMDGTVKFINIDKMTVHRKFSGHTTTGASVLVGVKNFAWAPMQKYVCSVGTDRVILMWDPYTLDVMCKLSGLASPVLQLVVDEKHQQILAASQRKSIRCWDSVTYEALDPVEDRTEYAPVNEISCALWVPELGGLITAANRLKLYSVEKSMEESGVVEQDDLACALFNEVFQQVAIVSRSGKVKVYLSEDGSLVSQFNARTAQTDNIHEMGSDQLLGAFVKDAAFDAPKRRLIIITSANEIQFWNCHNGSNLCVVTPRVPPYLQGQMAGLSSLGICINCFLHESIVFPVTQLAGAGMSSRTVGKKHVMLGLHSGIILGLHEGDELSEDVSILLVRSATSTGRVGKKAPTTAPSSAEGEAGNSRNTHLGRYSSVTPKQGFSGVMWMIMASKAESHLFVGYSDGVILLWDVAVAAVLMTMEADSFGASFSSMRRRIITSRNRAPPMTVYLEQQRKIQRQRSGEDELKSLKQIKIEIESRQNKPLAPGDITHFNYSFMSVENEMLPTESIVINAAGSLASQSASVRRPLSLTPAARPRSATLVQKAVSNNSLVKSSSPFGFHNFSRGTLIGVGKGRSGVRDVLPMSPTKDTDISPSHSYYSSHGSNLPSLLQEEEDVLHDRVESRASSRPQSGKLSRSVSRPESASNSRPTSGGMNRSRSREAWALGSFSRGNERRHNSNMSVLVSRAVVSEHYRLLLGACTDGMLRVWDLNSGEVICSCELIHSAEEIKAIKERGDQMHYQHDDSESAICKLALSEKSNHVIGGYDDGLVRVWLMGPHSTGQLRTVTITDTGELAIPPLQFHIEWLAHDTAISGVEVVNRETPSGGFSSYIVTSGQAQGVYMWTINGKLVGTFGASEWVISDSLTWRPKPIDAAELKLSQNTTRRLAAATVTNPSGEQCMPGYEWGEGLGRGLRLALYMEKQKMRVENRQATATYSMQDDHFSEVQGRHPVSDPVPPASSHRSSNGRSIRKERHLSNENNISFSGNNAGFTNYSKKLKGNTLGAKLNQLLSVAADQTLNSMLGRDAVGESSSPSEKLRSIVPAGSFVPRYRRNSGVVQTASPRVLCSPLKTPIHNSVGGLNPDSISIKQ